MTGKRFVIIDIAVLEKHVVDECEKWSKERETVDAILEETAKTKKPPPNNYDLPARRARQRYNVALMMLEAVRGAIVKEET